MVALAIALDRQEAVAEGDPRSATQALSDDAGIPVVAVAGLDDLLAFAGESGELGRERERLQRENPDFVFCGVQRGEALARHYASADLFVFPSRSETFGNVTLEAMASGVPTVAFNYGAAKEHLHDAVHGAAVENDEDFIHAAVNLAGAPALRRSMGLAASDAMQSLRPEQVAADFDDLLMGLVQRRSHATAAAA